MKIVKQFESNDFAKILYKDLYSHIDYKEGAPWLIWGLGNDGDLYVMHGFPYHLKETSSWIVPRMYISILEMKKIIKEFGHLIIFT